MNGFTMSLFYDTNKGMKAVIPKQHINLQRLIEIYNSDFVKEKTKPLMNVNLTDEEKQILKKQLPFITPYSCSTYRSKENVFHYNSNIICLDFDKLEIKEARLLKHQLSQHDSTILTAISPRQKGVKAIIYLPDTKDVGLIEMENRTPHLTKLVETFDLEFNKPTQTAIEYHYKFQKHNLDAILSKLDIKQTADISQLKIVQPYLIAHDEELYYNFDAKPLEIELSDFVAIERPFYYDAMPGNIEREKATETSNELSHYTKKRIEGFILKKVEFIKNDMLISSGKGRHQKIARCIDVLEKLHYLPEIKNTVIDLLINSITDMYGGSTNAVEGNAYESFNDICAGIIARRCDSIDRIINGEIEIKKLTA